MWKICLLGCLLLLVGVNVYAQSGVDGIPQSILSEVRSAQVLPKGQYTESRTWGIDQFFHLVGSAAADSDALDGKAWDAIVDKDGGSGFMIYGPYDQVEPGDYIAFFRIKMLEEPNDDVVGTVEVLAGKGVSRLGSRNIAASDLAVGKYVQIPVAFHFSSKDLECRLSWSGSTSLRIDKVTIFRFEGSNFPASLIPMVPQPVSPGTVKNIPYNIGSRPYKDIFPKSSKPASKLLVCDLTKVSPDWTLLITTLQGIVNRETPSIYCLDMQSDSLWLEWNKKRNWVTETETVTPQDLLTRFAHKIKGVIITDPNLPSSKNIATMMAGIENAVVVSPRLAKQLNLPVVADLRGRWTQNVDAYRWAFANLWSQMNHNTAACLWPETTYSRDYLVQHKIFIFWLPGRIDGAEPYANPAEELKFGEELLAALPVNSPIMGYPWAGENIGMGELPGVGLMAEYGKFLVGSVDVSNLSVHSGYEVQLFKQKKDPAPKLDSSKVYIAYTMSDGDNIPVLTATNWPQLWHQPERGKFPIGWTISPSSCILIPDVMDFYYTTASPNDSFLAAVSGVGYTYPNVYGKRFNTAGRKRSFDDFLSLTDQYMKRMNLSIVCPSGSGKTDLKRYSNGIPSLKSIFADYGRAVFNYEDATHVTARNIPVFHAICSWDPNGNAEKQISDMVDQIKRMAPQKTRPAFMHVFICNWFWDLAGLNEVLNRLGSQYVIVSPDQLTTMYSKWISENQVVTHLSPSSAIIEGYKFDTRYTIQNVTSKPMKVKFNVKGLTSASIKPATATLVSGKEVEVAISGKVSADKVAIDARGPFGLRESVTDIRRISKQEIIGNIPKNADLRFISNFNSDSLAHITGDRFVNSDGSITWVANKGVNKPGHIVYGPYASLDAGRYLALFRIKRTSEGPGDIAILDTCVAASISTSTRTIKASELPLGEYKSVALVFNHPGGAYETRMLWAGNASLVFDRVFVWKIGK